jgi:hypothetical protein
MRVHGTGENENAAAPAAETARRPGPGTANAPDPARLHIVYRSGPHSPGAGRHAIYTAAPTRHPGQQEHVRHAIETRVHPDRAAGRYRHHRPAHRPAGPGAGQGAAQQRDHEGRHPAEGDPPDLPVVGQPQRRRAARAGPDQPPARGRQRAARPGAGGPDPEHVAEPVLGHDRPAVLRYGHPDRADRGQHDGEGVQGRRAEVRLQLRGLRPQ